MEVIKRKISLEPATVRYTGGTSPYGTMTADTFYIKVMLTQNVDDMGMFTDMNYIAESVETEDQPNYTILTDKLVASGLTFPFMFGTQPPTSTNTADTTNIRVTGKELDEYWAYGSKISGMTDSKITDVRTYKKVTPFINDFDVNKTTYTNYSGGTIDGKSRITQQDILTKTLFSSRSFSATTYVFDANDDANIGTVNQTSGLLYRDFSGGTRGFNDDYGGEYSSILTELEYTGEGWNQTNTLLSASTKEEYLFGITQPPEVYSDVFIDRGNVTVFEKHLRLSEIESLEHLERYNNGFYRLVKQ